MDPFNEVSDTTSERSLAPHQEALRMDQATEPYLPAWVEFFPGGCANPSTVKTSGRLAPQDVQTGSGSSHQRR